jgi:LemA protein
MESVLAQTDGSALPIVAIGAGLMPILFLVIWAISISNRFVHLQNLIRESWANIDVALKRRHDLIPNLVETVKGYAAHEQATFDKVIQARSEAIASLANVAQLAHHESELSSGITRLLAMAEAYPELKASQHFLELQKELANTEDRIAAARRFYNANVRNFNTMLEQFPSNLFKGGRTAADYFEIEDVRMRDLPSVDLTP